VKFGCVIIKRINFPPVTLSEANGLDHLE